MTRQSDIGVVHTIHQMSNYYYKRAKIIGNQRHLAGVKRSKRVSV